MKLKTEQYVSTIKVWHRFVEGDILDTFLTSLGDMDTLNSISSYKRLAILDRHYHYTTEFWLSESSKKRLESKLDKVLKFLKENQIKIDSVESFASYEQIN